MNNTLIYWRAIVGGIGIACVAGAIFAQTALSSIIGLIVGFLGILAGYVITIYENGAR